MEKRKEARKGPLKPNTNAYQIALIRLHLLVKLAKVPFLVLQFAPKIKVENLEQMKAR